ncbi:hypothetical protein AOLI_G00210870 [Acnodon oligacanthus]
MLENGLFHHLSREWFVPLFSLPTLNESSCPPLIGRPGCIPRDFALQKEPRPASIHRIEASLAPLPHSQPGPVRIGNLCTFSILFSSLNPSSLHPPQHWGGRAHPSFCRQEGKTLGGTAVRMLQRREKKRKLMND